MLELKGEFSHFSLAACLGDKAVQIVQTPIRFIILCLLMTSICLSKKPLKTYWVTALWRKLGYHLWLNPILASAIFSAYVVYSEITLTCRPTLQEYICFIAFFYVISREFLMHEQFVVQENVDRKMSVLSLVKSSKA